MVSGRLSSGHSICYLHGLRRELVLVRSGEAVQADKLVPHRDDVHARDDREGKIHCRCRGSRHRGGLRDDGRHVRRRHNCGSIEVECAPRGDRRPLDDRALLLLVLVLLQLVVAVVFLRWVGHLRHLPVRPHDGGDVADVQRRVVFSAAGDDTSCSSRFIREIAYFRKYYYIF